MKKLSLILAGALLLGGISFASPVIKQQPAASGQSSKQAAKPASKPAATKGAKKGSDVKKGAPVKKDASAPAK